MEAIQDQQLILEARRRKKMQKSQCNQHYKELKTVSLETVYILWQTNRSGTTGSGSGIHYLRCLFLNF